MIKPPEMYVVAGPPGAGKSTAFSLKIFAERVFNADDRAAQLNGGSYRAIPPDIRRQVNLEFEAFVRESIAKGTSFALETTLRSNVTFEQARIAKAAGFQTFMIYVALGTFKQHLERVTRRASAGGHSASETVLRHIYDSSMANLSAAILPDSGVDGLRVFDNSALDRTPRLVLQTRNGRVDYMSTDFPAWLQNALHWSDSDVARIRSGLSRHA